MIVSPSQAPGVGVAGQNAVVAPLFSTIAFRETEEEAVFKQIEQRLCRRDPIRFAGYAEARLRANEGETAILARAAATVVQDSRWHGLDRLFYNVELEVWMDLSQADVDAMAVYETCLEQGVPFYVHHSGPFTPLFGRLLLQKNGFERVSEGDAPEGAMELEALLQASA